MVKIILTLLFFGLAWLYEVVKKQRERQTKVSEDTPSETMMQRLELQRQSDEAVRGRKTVSSRRKNIKRHSGSTPAVPNSSRSERVFLPGEDHEIPDVMTGSPGVEKPGVRGVEAKTAASSAAEDADRDHYERWRRAVIDAEILSPKF